MLIKFDEVVKICYLIMICVVIIISNCSSDLDEAVDVINISNTPGCSEHPAIAVDSRGYFYVVWDNAIMSGIRLYIASRSPDGEWSKPVQPFAVNVGKRADIAVDNSDDIYLVWQNTNSAGWMEILYSEKSGENDWTEPDTISLYGLSCSPHLAIDNTNSVHLVWGELKGAIPLYYIKKTSGGAWSMPVELPKEEAYFRYGAEIAVDPQGYAHVVWAELKSDTGASVVYTTNATADSWSDPEDIVFYRYSWPSDPSIAVDNEGTVHVVWRTRGIFYTYKSKNSQWQTPVCICSTSSVPFSEPDLVSYNNILYLIWGDESKIHFTSKQKGEDWEELRVLNTNTVYSIDSPKIAVSSSGVGIVFATLIDFDSDNHDIFFFIVP
jgi:hypothetical protein